MELAYDDTQDEIRALAADVTTRLATTERIQQVEQTADRFDRDLWAELARTGLLGVAVPESRGGLGFGMVELGLVCQAVGRTVAPVPLVPTVVAAAALGDHDLVSRVASGDAVLAVASRQSTLNVSVDDGRLSGELVGVPWAHVADRVMVDAADGLFLLDPGDTTITSARGITTGGQVALDLTLTGTPAERIGDETATALHRRRWLATLAATQSGVCAGAVRIAADYTSHREQFGKPLSAFQGVSLKAADAYVDATALAAVALQAAWAIDTDQPDAQLAALTAGWWAAEGGQHCVHITQHIHGGMGADITYPVHRFFLWGKQIELLVGGASALLAELGGALALSSDAGDSLVLT
jgi:acyl-CoA dehydrogenase